MYFRLTPPVVRLVASGFLLVCGIVVLAISAHVESSTRTFGISTATFTYDAFVGAFSVSATRSPGVAAVLGIFISVLTFVFALMNKHKEKQLVAHGKPGKIIDTSMHKVYQAAPDDEVAGRCRLGDQTFLDLTDVQNDEFVYSY